MMKPITAVVLAMVALGVMLIVLPATLLPPKPDRAFIADSLVTSTGKRVYHLRWEEYDGFLRPSLPEAWTSYSVYCPVTAIVARERNEVEYHRDQCGYSLLDVR